MEGPRPSQRTILWKSGREQELFLRLNQGFAGAHASCKLIKIPSCQELYIQHRKLVPAAQKHMFWLMLSSPFKPPD